MSWLPIGFLDAVRSDPAAFAYGRMPLVVKLAAGTADSAAEWSRAVDAAAVVVLQKGSRFPAMVQIPFTHDGAAATWESAWELLLTFSNQGDLLKYLPLNKGWTQTDLNDVQKLLRNLAGGGLGVGSISKLSRDHMRELFGFARRIADDAPPQWISRTDLVLGMAMFARIVSQEIDILVPTAAEANALKEALWQVPGLATSAAVYLCRSGYGWGARLEIRTIAVRLVDGVLPANIRMSLPMPDGKLGPDIIEYINRGAGIVADLWQCKAYKSFGAFAGNRATNEPLRQVFSDISRFAPNNWRAAAQGADAAEGAATVGLSGIYKFTLDFDHFWENAADPIHEIILAGSSQGMVLFIETSGKTADEIRLAGAAAMKLVMDAQASKITQTIEALAQTGALDDAIKANIGHVINNQIARRFKEGAKPARLALSEITPQKLKEMGFITEAELPGMILEAANNGDQFLRIAAQKALGLTPDMLASMPPFDVGMELVMKGTQTGIFNAAVDSF